MDEALPRGTTIVRTHQRPRFFALYRGRPADLLGPHAPGTGALRRDTRARTFRALSEMSRRRFSLHSACI